LLHALLHVLLLLLLLLEQLLLLLHCSMQVQGQLG
jgi:hypothetical protein